MIRILTVLLAMVLATGCWGQDMIVTCTHCSGQAVTIALSFQEVCDRAKQVYAPNFDASKPKIVYGPVTIDCEAVIKGETK